MQVKRAATLQRIALSVLRCSVDDVNNAIAVVKDEGTANEFVRPLRAFEPGRQWLQQAENYVKENGKFMEVADLKILIFNELLQLETAFDTDEFKAKSFEQLCETFQHNDTTEPLCKVANTMTRLLEACQNETCRKTVEQRTSSKCSVAALPGWLTRLITTTFITGGFNAWTGSLLEAIPSKDSLKIPKQVKETRKNVDAIGQSFGKYMDTFDKIGCGSWPTQLFDTFVSEHNSSNDMQGDWSFSDLLAVVKWLKQYASQMTTVVNLYVDRCLPLILTD